jgi:hypothetical protein
MGRDYIRFDEIEDVLVSADLIALTAPLVARSPSYWKWIIVGAHNALQGAMVCALCDTNGTSVLTEKSASQMLNWLQKSANQRGEPPQQRLAEFLVLLERCIGGQFNCKKLGVTPDQLLDIQRLHKEFRNNFAHFTPKGWAIEKLGLPRIINAALNAVGDLMGQPQIKRRLSGNRIRRLKRALFATRQSLTIQSPH